MNKFLKILIFVLIAVLQLTLMPLLAIKGMIPNIILIWSIILFLSDFETDAFYLAALGGLILDLAGPFFFGFNCIFITGFIFIIRFLLQKIVAELNVPWILTAVFIFSLFFAVLENIFLGRLPGTDIFIYAGYSVFIGLIAFLSIQKWHRKVQVKS